ncbi:MAG TPA: hypothetical protein VHQ86_01760, partial [Candidatus Saccharimonadia bacterium]|nr:hypothetical protein [Candidatus Saccharimonadia bacterium]
MKKPAILSSENGMAMILEIILGAVVLGVVGLAVFNLYQAKNSAKTNHKPATTATAAPSVTPSPGASASPVAPTPKPKPVAFKVSKVYFSQAPQIYDTSKVGPTCATDKYTFSAVADITATAAGTVSYHWQEYDSISSSKAIEQSEAVAFSQAGTKSVSRS